MFDLERVPFIDPPKFLTNDNPCGLLCAIFLKKINIYIFLWKGEQSGRKTEISHSCCIPLKSLQWPGLGQASARNQELHPGFLPAMGAAGPQLLEPSPAPSQYVPEQETEMGSGSWNSNSDTLIWYAGVPSGPQTSAHCLTCCYELLSMALRAGQPLYEYRWGGPPAQGPKLLAIISTAGNAWVPLLLREIVSSSSPGYRLF